MAAEFRPHGLLTHLTAHGVDFVVVGGIAAVLHGAERNTFDLDICPAAGQANLDALGKALIELSPRLRGVEEDVPFVPDGRSLQNLQILNLATARTARRNHPSRRLAALRHAAAACATCRHRIDLDPGGRDRRPAGDEARSGARQGQARHRGARGHQGPEEKTGQ